MRIPGKFYIAGGLLLVILVIAIPLIIIGVQQQGSGQPVPTAESTAPASTITPVGGGKAYYVSPSGNDQNDGSRDHPFATIQKAADVVTPGSVVHVLPGTYTDAVLVETDGTANARITFVSDTRWAAKIHTTDSDDPWKTNADYIDIIGFDISSDGSRDGMVNSGSYTRTIGNRIHDIPGTCDNIGGSGVTDGNYKAHDNDIIGNLVFHIGDTYPKLCQYVLRSIIPMPEGILSIILPMVMQAMALICGMPRLIPSFPITSPLAIRSMASALGPIPTISMRMLE